MKQEELKDRDEVMESEEYEEEDERFYEGEEDGQAQDAPAEEADDGEVDDLRYFLQLMKGLRSTLLNGKAVPFVNKKLVDVDTCVAMLDDMSANLPQAVEYGMKVYDECARVMNDAETQAISCVSSAEMKANAAVDKAKKQADEILKNAEKEARALVADAQQQADMMIRESEIVKRAQEESRRIRNDAAVAAKELRLKTTDESIKMMSRVQRELIEANKSLDRLRKEVDIDEEDY